MGEQEKSVWFFYWIILSSRETAREICEQKKMRWLEKRGKGIMSTVQEKRTEVSAQERQEERQK